MELLEYNSAQGRETRRAFIRDGIAGNYDVVFAMVRIIRESSKDYRVKNIAVELMRERNINSYSDTERILRGVYNYVADKVVYISDIAGNVESIKSAYRTLLDGFGDCDDLTVTVCSLLGVLGFENVYIALAKYFPNDTSFSHVYPVVYVDGVRYVLDASLPSPEFNKEVAPYEVKEIPCFQEVKGLDGLSGVWNNLKHLGAKVGKVAITAIPATVNYLPLNFGAAAALHTGGQLLTANQSKSYAATASLVISQLDEIIHQLLENKIALDLAQSNAAQYAAQLSLVKDDNENKEVIKKAVQKKLDFIRNFEVIAKEHNLTVTYLNPNAMLLLGAGAGAYGLYKLYQYYKEMK